jgi:hypothetical protein
MVFKIKDDAVERSSDHTHNGPDISERQMIKITKLSPKVLNEC